MTVRHLYASAIMLGKNSGHGHIEVPKDHQRDAPISNNYSHNEVFDKNLKYLDLRRKPQIQQTNRADMTSFLVYFNKPVATSASDRP